MFQALAKWYVSRSIDTGSPLPSWVQQRVQKDPQLREFQQQSFQLAERMRIAAAAKLSSKRGQTPFQTEPSVPPVRERQLSPVPNGEAGRLQSTTISDHSITRVLFALAATLLLIVGVQWLNSRSNTDGVVVLKVPPVTSPTEHSESEQDSQRVPIVQPSTLASEFPKRLEHWWEGRRRITEGLTLQPSADQLNDFVAVLSFDASSMVRPAADLGTNYGRLLVGFEQQVQDEQQRLIRHAASTFKVVTDTLVRGTGQLARLK